MDSKQPQCVGVIPTDRAAALGLHEVRRSTLQKKSSHRLLVNLETERFSNTRSCENCFQHDAGKHESPELGILPSSTVLNTRNPLGKGLVHPNSFYS